MKEVSCRVLDVVASGLAERGVTREAWALEACVDPSLVIDTRGRLDWADVVSLLDVLATHIGDTEALAQLGFDGSVTPTFSFPQRLVTALASPTNMYEFGTRWFGRSLFGIVEASFERLDDGRVRETLEVPEPYEPSVPLFHVIGGTLRSAPRLLGLEPAEVECTIEGRRAIYDIRLPETRPSLLRRLQHRLALPVALQAAVGQLSTQQSRIEQSHHDLRTAHDRIQLQAERLAAINRMGAELTQHIEFGALTDALCGIVSNEVDDAGIALWLGKDEGGLSLLGERGPREGEPSDRYPLEIAGRSVGRLDVWRPEAGNARRVLEDLVPWIAIALDNVRSYAALREHNQLLEARVAERTSDLVKANAELQDQVAARQRAHDALEDSIAQLRSAERLASVGTFAAGIAHEINNPVASILAAAEFALACREDGDFTKVAGETLEDIAEHSLRCAEIVHGVMQFSREEAGEVQQADLGELVEEVLRCCESYGRERGVSFAYQPNETTIEAPLQVYAVEQALLHVLRNAVDASRAGAEVQCKLELHGDWVEIRVRDTGAGITPANRERIFDPFFTTRRNEGSYGLGLAVAHGVVSKHRGKIEIQSEVGCGTEVLIRLPHARHHPTKP